MIGRTMNESELRNSVKELSDMFNELCEAKYNSENLEYLGQNTISNYANALVELAVSCRQQFIKLLMLQEELQRELADKADENGEIKMGIEGFNASVKPPQGTK